MSKAPDSTAWEGQAVEVYATPEFDNPASGSVSIEMQTSHNSATIIRLTRKTAFQLRDELTRHLNETEATR